MRLSDDARLWNDSHETSFILSDLLATVMQAFCTLHRIAWSAPWREERQ